MVQSADESPKYSTMQIHQFVNSTTRQHIDMKTLGLIGFPLSHSFSKKYFSEKFEKENIAGWQYELFPLETIEKLPDLLAENPSIAGLNVTIPYKEAVIPYMDEVDESAAFGAVNTIKIENGKLRGFNTDVYGFEESLKPLLKTHHTAALVLGTGGAAKAVASVLKRLGIVYKYVSRTPHEGQFSYKNINKDILKKYPLIVNTTPLGMYPNVEFCPDLAYHEVTDKHLLYDLVYNPNVTTFLKNGKKQGADIKNGLEMLYLQAERAWSIWNS